MTSHEDAPPSLSLHPDSRIKIPDLSPQRNDLQELHIAAQVVLIWPYSSSTRRFSLLLSEADARPLKGTKQVKVTFLNGAARAAQESRAGIGDTIRLSLQGFQWAETEDVISTPGKRIDCDLQFRKQVAFELTRQTGAPQLVHYRSAGTPSPIQSPAINGVVDVIKDLPLQPSQVSIPYATPARNIAGPSLGPYFDSPLDPFAEDKEYVYGRSRKRTKFARPSGDWKLVDDEPDYKVDELLTHVQHSEAVKTAETQVVDNDDKSIYVETPVPEVIDLISPTTEAFGQAYIPAPTTIPVSVQRELSPEPEDLEVSRPASPIFVKPQAPARPRREQLHIDLDDSADSEATSTPRLMPMPSPGLPLVSPLVRQAGVGLGYFPTFQNGVSELEASGRAEGSFDEERRSSAAAISADDSLIMLDERPVKPQSVVPDGVADQEVFEEDDMYGAPPHPEHTSMRYEESPNRARDALDVLEEFLQISPTVPKAPYHDLNEAELQALKSSDGHEEVNESSIEEREIEQDVEEADRVKSPEAQYPQEVDDIEEVISRPQSRGASLDGTVDNEEYVDTPEQVKGLQKLHKGDKTRELALEPLAQVAEQIRNEVKPLVADAVSVLDESRKQLMSPQYTQEDRVASEVDAASPERPAQEFSHLPTPDNTQSQAQLPPQILSSQEEIAIEDVGESMTPTNQNKSIRQSRRISQQIGTRSMQTEISSPYFMPSKAPIPQSSPVREQMEPPSSPPAEVPSSPIRRVTRSQKAASQPPADEPIIPITRTSAVSAESEVSTGTGIKTSLSYYPALSSLREHFSQSVDVAAVAVDESTKVERAKSGPRDYHTTLRLVDSSLDPTTGTRVSVQIFRPDRQAIPTTHRSDVVILRNFKVQTAKHKWMLLSTDSSAWAVFSINPNSRSKFDDVTMSGPPLEYNRGETAEIKKLVQWWEDEGEARFPAFGRRTSSTVDRSQIDVNGELHVDTQTTKPQPSEKSDDDDGEQAVIESIEPPPLSPRRTRRRNNMTNHSSNINDNERPSLRNTTTTPPPTRQQPHRRAKSKTPASTRTNEVGSTPTTAARASSGPTSVKGSRKSPSLVHELRDGTKYVDDRERTGGVVHELRDGRNYVDE